VYDTHQPYKLNSPIHIICTYDFGEILFEKPFDLETYIVKFYF